MTTPETRRRLLVDAQRELGPTPEWWWSLRRGEWGGLSADDLWDLGCEETVARIIVDHVRVANRVRRERQLPLVAPHLEVEPWWLAAGKAELAS